MNARAEAGAWAKMLQGQYNIPAQRGNGLLGAQVWMLPGAHGPWAANWLRRPVGFGWGCLCWQRSMYYACVTA